MENPFDLKVREQVERLQTQNYGSLEAASYATKNNRRIVVQVLQ